MKDKDEQDNKLIEYCKKTKTKVGEVTEYYFGTTYTIEGQERGGEIWAQDWAEAKEFLKQRAASEKILFKGTSTCSTIRKQ
ncbi:hypothetical protein [Dysgonomonas sp. ZJ279]|uniref:hypothetical protein n=1 Tax=Dysgonomonas sp. ZJ279 TaxID=2709796 RepID=UPI0013EBE22D|nr:hypothetical protein [Dysgonomonas sp. ZJ279]